MSRNCLNINLPEIKELGKKLKIATSTLRGVIEEYRDITGDEEGLPNLYEANEILRGKQVPMTYNQIELIRQNYENPVEFVTREDAIETAATLSTLFPREAVKWWLGDNNHYVVEVAKPVGYETIIKNKPNGLYIGSVGNSKFWAKAFITNQGKGVQYFSLKNGKLESAALVLSQVGKTTNLEWKEISTEVGDNKKIQAWIQKNNPNEDFKTGQPKKGLAGDLAIDFDGLMLYLKKGDIPLIREQILKKNRYILEEAVDEALTFLEELENDRELNVYVKDCLRWLKNNSIRLPEDNDAVLEAFREAREYNIDTQKYKNPVSLLMDVITQEIDRNVLDEAPPVDPFKIKEIHFSEEVIHNSGRVMQVFDVDDTPEARMAISQLIADTTPKHKDGTWALGSFSSPWCIGYFNYHNNTKTITRPPLSDMHWGVYSRQQRQIAFIDGYPVAFRASGRAGVQWWDYDDAPHEHLETIPLVRESRFKSETDTTHLPAFVTINGVEYSIYSKDGYPIIRNKRRELANSLAVRSVEQRYYGNNPNIASNSVVGGPGFNIFAYPSQDITSSSYVGADYEFLVSSVEDGQILVKVKAGGGRGYLEDSQYFPLTEEEREICEEYKSALNELEEEIESRGGDNISRMVDKVIDGVPAEEAFPFYNKLLRLVNASNDLDRIFRDLDNRRTAFKNTIRQELRDRLNRTSTPTTAHTNAQAQAAVYNAANTLEVRAPLEYQTETEPQANLGREYQVETEELTLQEAENNINIDNTLRDAYNKYMQREVYPELEQKLQNILKKYHVEYIYGNLKEVFGDDVLGISDTLNKVIYLSDGGDVNALTGVEEFAHSFIELMGSAYHKEENRGKYPENMIYSQLRDEVESTSLYQQTLEEYKNNPAYQTDNGSPDLPKIKKEALGKALATAILENYEKSKDKTFLDKVKDWFYKVIDWFRANIAKKGLRDIDKTIDSVAKSILDGTYQRKYLDFINSKDYRQLGYEETLDYAREHQGETPFTIMRTAVQHGGFITGSLSVRAQSPLYRRSMDTLHDIDVMVPIDVHHFHTSNSDLFERPRYLRQVTNQDIILDKVKEVPYIQRMLEEIPDLTLLYAYFDNRDVVVVNAISCEDKALVDKFKSLEGNFNSRMKHFTEDERSKIYLVDFFLRNDNMYVDESIEDTENGITLTPYQASFKEKLKMGRAKDVFDYQRLNPTNRQYLPIRPTSQENNNVEAEPTYVQNMKESIENLRKAGMFQLKNPYNEKDKTFTFNDGTTIKAPFKPNDQQIEALNYISDFLKSDETSMTLSGYAGTGKTSIMEMIAEKCSKQGKNIRFSATTHQAAGVLKDKVEKLGYTATTVHKLLGIVLLQDESKDYDVRNVENFIKDSEATYGDVVVIDEASMVSEGLFSVIEEVAKSLDLKVIYLGDEAQLPPVKEGKNSKVFNEKNIVRLTKVERTGDNAILQEATNLRNNRPLSEVSSFNSEGQGVAYINQENRGEIDKVIKHYVSGLKEDNKSFRILTFTRKGVSDYNKKVRQLLGYTGYIPKVNEPLIGYANWKYDRNKKDYAITNSSPYTVTRVEEPVKRKVETSDGKYVEVEVTPITLKDLLNNSIKVDYIDIIGNNANKEAVLELAKLKASLWRGFRRASSKEEKREYLSKINEIENFLCVNDDISIPNKKAPDGKTVLQSKVIDFGYASTIHKSQGSTFTNVLVDNVNVEIRENLDKGKSVIPTPELSEEDYIVPDYSNFTLEKTEDYDDMWEDSDNLPMQAPAPKIPASPTDNMSEAQKLRYVAVSRATDTVTIIDRKSNIKKEDSPLNHIPDNTTKQSSVSKEITSQLIHQLETILTPLGNKVHWRADMEKFLKENPQWATQIQQIIESNKELTQSLNIIDKAINTGNWTDEALEKLDNLNNEEYGTILKRFSQEELRSSDGILKQAETILARGSSQRDRGETQAYSKTSTEQQEKQIESWAKENGLWYNSYQEATDDSLESVIESDGGKFSSNSGSESMVYVPKKPSQDGVTKAIDASHYAGNIEKLFDKIILHNSLFPETALEVIGFGKDRGDTFRVIVKQKFIGGVEPSIDELHRFVRGLGLEKKSGWYYTKDGKRISDLNINNIIKVGENTFYVIDCDIEFTQEHLNATNENPQFLQTSQGEVYGFVTPNGDIYLDETRITPEHPIHEYTHLWDRAVAQRNPRLWKRGVTLMKETPLWNEILNDPNYGQKWQAMDNMTAKLLESLVASEVHSRLVGTQGEALLNRIAEELGSKGIVEKLKRWILSFWKDLKATFSDWSDDELQKLTLKDFNRMTVRDFADAVNFAEAPTLSEHTGITAKQVKEAKDLMWNGIRSIREQIAWIEERKKWNKATKEHLEELTRLQQDLVKKQRLYDGLKNGVSEVIINEHGVPQIVPKVQDLSYNSVTTDNQVNRETQQTPVQKEFIANAELYSGAARGADTVWGNAARKYGIKVKDFTVTDWDTLSSEERSKYNQEYEEVVNIIGRKKLSEELYRGKLVRRDMMQADHADAIFAVGNIVKPGETDNGWRVNSSTEVISGGTAYATQRGILRGIPVYVFDQRTNEWKTWDYASNTYVVTEEPKLTSHAAVIGDERLTPEGQLAIEKVVATAIGKTMPSTTQKSSITPKTLTPEQVTKTTEEVKAVAPDYISKDYVTQNDFYLYTTEISKEVKEALRRNSLYTEENAEEILNTVTKDSFLDYLKGGEKSDVEKLQKEVFKELEKRGYSEEAISDITDSTEQINKFFKYRLLSYSYHNDSNAFTDAQGDLNNVFTANRLNLEVVATIDALERIKEESRLEESDKKKSEEFAYSDYANNVDKALSNLADSDIISSAEVAEVAEDVGNWISDHITELLENPDQIKENYEDVTEKLEGKDLSALTRLELVNLIGPDKIMEACKLVFEQVKDNVDDFEFWDKVDLLLENWDAIAHLANNTIKANEGFEMVSSEGETHKATETQSTPEDIDTYENDPDNYKEEEGSTENHWTIEVRTVAVTEALSRTPVLREAFRNIYELDKNGNKVQDQWTINKRIPTKKVVKSMLGWLQRANDIKEAAEILKTKVEANPWVQQIIDRLSNFDGSQADFQSAFWKILFKPYQLWSVTTYEDGKFNVLPLNNNEGLKVITDELKATYRMGLNQLFTPSGISESVLSEVSKNFSKLKKFKRGEVGSVGITTNNINELCEIYADIATKLGYNTTPDMVKAGLTVDKFESAFTALNYIIQAAKKHIHNNNFNPFGTLEEGGMAGNLNTFFAPIAESMVDTTRGVVYEDGKMYQNNVTPSYLTMYVKSFHSSAEKFNEFMEREFKKYDWCYDTEEGEYRIPWLQRMDIDETSRMEFAHKVELSFNGKKYLERMSPEELALSFLANYFSSSAKGELVPAWFRVPLQSNKKSNDFIKFYSYRGARYREAIASDLLSVFAQEMDRIRTVKLRKERGKDTISNLDSNGEHFMYLPFLNDYLEGGKKQSSELGQLINSKLQGKEADPEGLLKLVTNAIIEGIEAEAEAQATEWEESGLFEQIKKIPNIKGDIREAVKNFVWNDTFAAINILEILAGDIAQYSNTDDLQKRLSEWHTPGERPNIHATDYKGNPVTDTNTRAAYIADFKGVLSNIIDNLEVFFDRRIEKANSDEKEGWLALKDYLIGEKGLYRDINVTDGQAYNCPTSFRKKAFCFALWDQAKENLWKKVRNNSSGEYNLTELKEAFSIFKPFLYAQIEKSSGVEGAPLRNFKLGVQHKNSEYLILMAEALLKNENTGLPNILKVIYEVMEDSHFDRATGEYKTDGLDTIMFDSAIKTGLRKAVDLGQFIKDAGKEPVEALEAKAKALLMDSLYNTEENQEDGITTYNEDYVDKIPLEYYALIQSVPNHFEEGTNNTWGSQERVIIPAAVQETDAFGNISKYNSPTKGEVTAKEFVEEYFNTWAKKIQYLAEDLSNEFAIGKSRRERNAALSKILQREAKDNLELWQSCAIDPVTGEFKVPKNDSNQSKRIQQLINAHIKKKINKLTGTGGSLVQVSNFGATRRLSVKWKGKNGETLKSYEEYASEPRRAGVPEAEITKRFKEYLKNNQAGIAHYEILAPAFYKNKFNQFRDKHGNINIKAIRALNPDLLKIIGYRTPTEEMYSIAPLMTVNFLPEWAGDAIMWPWEITLINDSDFDVDKTNTVLKAFNIKWNGKKITEIHDELFDYITKSLPKLSSEGNIKLHKMINMFLSDPYDEGAITGKSTKDMLFLNSADYDKLLGKYISLAYSVEVPTSDGEIDNNIFDMTWEVLTHENSVERMLNPGGFERYKSIAYKVARYKADPTITWEEVDKLDTKTNKNEYLKAQKLNSNLIFIGTHLRYYKQNSAAATTLSVFAVNRTAHALLSNMGYNLDISKALSTSESNSMVLNDYELSGIVKLDPQRDRTGAYTGKTVGGGAAASADAAKEPSLPHLNINGATINMLTSGIRLGVDLETLSMLLASSVVDDLLSKYNRSNLDPESYNSLISIIDKELGYAYDIYNKYSTSDTSAIYDEPITMEELITGLRLPVISNKELEDKSSKLNTLLQEDQISESQGEINGITESIAKDLNNYKLRIKILTALSNLYKIAESMQGGTLATRFNSVSSAVGPLIIDNLMMEFKMDRQGDSSAITTLDGVTAEEKKANNEDTNNYLVTPADIIGQNPLLLACFQGYNIARIIMGDMIEYSHTFEDIINSTKDTPLYNTLTTDSKVLSNLSDFYQTCLAFASGVVKYSDENLSYYITKFPTVFVENKYKEKPEYRNNPFIQGITPKSTSQGFVYLNIDMLGMSEKERNTLRDGWRDVYKNDKQLAIQLFNYWVYRGGIGFSPKTATSIIPLYMKQRIKGYAQMFSEPSIVSTEKVLDLFIRNNWRNNKLVPLKKKVQMFHLHDNMYAVKNYEGEYFKMRSKEGDYLMFRFVDTTNTQENVYAQVDILGGNGDYVELSNKAMQPPYKLNTKGEEPSTDKELPGELPWRDLSGKERENMIHKTALELFKGENETTEKVEEKLSRNRELLKTHGRGSTVYKQVEKYVLKECEKRKISKEALDDIMKDLC